MKPQELQALISSGIEKPMVSHSYPRKLDCKHCASGNFAAAELMGLKRDSSIIVAHNQ